MTQVTPTPTPAWTITGQMERTMATEGGGLVAGVMVMFRSAAGHAGSVFLPDARYNVDNVRAAISERVALLDAVGSLTG